MRPESELGRNPGFFQDLVEFLIQNKKWWLIPIVAVLLLMGVLIALGGTSAAPFIYTLF
jgi:hypothetical protein